MNIGRWLGIVSLIWVAPAEAAPPQPPRLLIVIAVDQLSADLFDEYRPQFTGGFARLASGTLFRNGFQSHASTETCPGHSTILTGDRPARTGIIGNTWIDWAAPRADKKIYCAEDERAPGTDSDHYQLSAVDLRVPTLGDLLKARTPASRVVAVAGKDRAAVMLGGHSPDQLWYWGGKGFETDLKGPVPASIAPVNAAIAAEISQAQPALDPPPFCSARAQPIAIAGHVPVGAGAFARPAGDAGAFHDSPEFDGATLALSASLIRELGLGRGSAPDILAIGLSATDYVGHDYGSGGQEMCLQLLSLDRDLGDFFAQLDSWGVDYAVALTADHGGLDIPERQRLKGVAGAARIDDALYPKAIGAAVAAQTGLAGPILVDGGPIQDIYLDAHLKGADRDKARDAALAQYRKQPQVYAAYSKDEIAATKLPSGDPAGWSVIERVRASFDADRSGDLYVVLKPNITPIAHARGAVANHGSVWDYDRRVPILFWRRGVAGATVETSAETADIMPTLAAMLGLQLAPASVDGKCLSGAAGVTCPSP